MKNWVKLIDAVIEMACKDAAGGGHWASDAKAFLESEWCDELKFVSREWKADKDRRRAW
jgi:hypothetical protein